MSELEKAAINDAEIRRLDKEIEQVKEFQIAAMKGNDNIIIKIWADKVRELKAERSALDRQNKYMKLSIFVQVVKTKLTPSEFEDCWDTVGKILEHPELMQP